MASSNDPRELTPEERRAFGNWYAQQLESDLGLTVPERGLRSNRMRMERAFAAGLAARASSPAPDGDGSLEREAFSRATGEAAEKFDERDEEMSWVWICAKLFFGPRGAAVASSPVPESSRDWVICLRCRSAWPWSAPETACECSMANERTFRAAPVPVRDEERKPDRLVLLAKGALHILDDEREATGVDEWDESDPRCFLYNAATAILERDANAAYVGAESAERLIDDCLEQVQP